MVVAASVGSDKPWEGRERSMQLLVTGATGKVGVNLIERLLSDFGGASYVSGRCVTTARSRRPID